MKILHTADIHLGAKFLGVTDSARFRRQLKDTFIKIIDLARAEKVALFLIAGDLFDSSQPSPELINFVSRQFASLQIPICLIPGTHDKYLFQKEKAFTQITNLTILDSPQWIAKEFPQLDCTVYGINPQNQYPLADLQTKTNTKYHIALIHAGFHIPDKIRDEHLVRKEDIGKCGMDYLALGHWHNLADYSQGDVRAWYSGVPEPLAIDEKNVGHVIVVDLETKDVVPKKVGTIKCVKDEIDGSDIEDVAGIKLKILKDAGPNLRKAVRLKGFCTNPLDNIADELREQFGQLRIVNDTQMPIQKINPEAYNHCPFIKKYLELLEQEVVARSGEEKTVAIKARDYGLNLLEGKEVI